MSLCGVFRVSLTHNYPQFKIRVHLSFNHFRHSVNTFPSCLHVFTVLHFQRRCWKYCRHQWCLLQKFLEVHLLFHLLKSSIILQQLQIKAKPFFRSDVCDTKQASSSSIKGSSSSVQTYLESNTSWLTSQYKHKFLNILAYHTFPDQPATVLIHLL